MLLQMGLSKHIGFHCIYSRHCLYFCTVKGGERKELTCSERKNVNDKTLRQNHFFIWFYFFAKNQVNFVKKII